MPLIEPVIVSATDTVWLPTVLNVTLKVPWPLVSDASAGRRAALSLLVKWTVPL